MGASRDEVHEPGEKRLRQEGKDKKRSLEAPALVSRGWMPPSDKPAEQGARKAQRVEGAPGRGVPPAAASGSGPATAVGSGAVGAAAAAANAANAGSSEVFVKFLPRDVDEAELAALFSHCGPLAKPPVLLRDYTTGAPKGAGWLTFDGPAGALAALGRNGHPLRGRHLEVSLATCRRERPGLRGQTQAAGTHTPALFHEVLSALVSPDPGGIFVDATFGRGGHTRRRRDGRRHEQSARRARRLVAAG
jgi:hypothetical protein